MKNIKDFILHKINEEKQTPKGFYKAIVKASDFNELYEKTLRKYHINDEEFEDLMYIIHSDSHVASDDLKRTVNKFIKNNKIGEVPKIPLYRGCSDKEYNDIISKHISPVDVMSFSEDQNIAKKFGNNVIEIISDLPLFCYHKFLGGYLTAMEQVDYDEFDGEDGEYLRNSAYEEAEWLCPNNYKFEEISKNKFKLTTE